MTQDSKIVLLAGQKRDPESNGSTGYDTGKAPSAASDFERCFRRHYAGFRSYVQPFDQPGVAAIAVDTVRDVVAGIACLAARAGEPNALVIGRHSESGLLVVDDSALSLRHVAVIVDPATSFRPGTPVTYRVIDLRSTAGLQLETGALVGGLRSDGPTFVSSGRYLFLFFPTGDPSDWPDSPADAWSFVPERVYLDERPRVLAEGSRPRRLPVPRRDDGRATLVERLCAPAGADQHCLLRNGELPVARLVVTSAVGTHRQAVGGRALRDGIVIGRDPRCEAQEVLGSDHLSRVHLLIISLGDAVYAIDTASTNGCYGSIEYCDPFTVRRLELGDTIFCGIGAAVTWQRSD
jgi:hypothetical protein